MRLLGDLNTNWILTDNKRLFLPIIECDNGTMVIVFKKRVLLVVHTEGFMGEMILVNP